MNGHIKILINSLVFKTNVTQEFFVGCFTLQNVDGKKFIYHFDPYNGMALVIAPQILKYYMLSQN